MKDLLVKTALAFFGIVVALLTFEFAARILPSRLLPPSLRSIVLELNARAHSIDPYIPDPKLWYVIRPRTDFVFHHPDSNFRMKTNLNFPMAGFRGGTLGGPTWGVALGDSFTFGLGVNQEATWVARLAELSGHEIVNLGVPGWGPQQYTRTLEEYGVPLKPKIVLYGLFSNDVGNVTVFEKHDGHFNDFSMREFLRSNSVIFNLFRRVRRAKKSLRDIDLGNIGQFNSADLKSGLLADSHRFPQGWPIAEREIETAYRDSQRSNATFVLLYFPSKEEVYWEPLKEKAKSLESFDAQIYRLRNASMDFCQSHRLRCIDLTPALKKDASQGEQVYLTFDSHWSELGNRVVAQEIYKYLAAQKIL